ncbi:FHA domain-containing protein [Streptomyces sp. SBT349]|uniref:FHA domain-containing protein n=1 Tax=Streptomyces sp. SBT349 TaxID=1580539 RepID=UPI00066E6454|nr:FHA domain-containing protein [Streptomyces sp. SBT349]
MAITTNHRSLARGVPPAPTGTIHARSIGSDIAFRPREGRRITFGRNSGDVQVCIGGDDRRVSRRQGTLTHEDSRWWVRNLGRLPIRLPDSQLLFTEEEPVPLRTGYTPLFLRGSSGREHLLELYVTGEDESRPGPEPDDPTQAPRTWHLEADEKLALVILARRYLLHEAGPQPLTWRDAFSDLCALQPDAGWTVPILQHMIEDVRKRLSAEGVRGLTAAEVQQPVGNALNDNLIKELLLTTTIVPTDLAVLDGAFGE